MPGFIKTPEDEKKWNAIKHSVAKQRGKKIEDFTDRDWATVNAAWHKSEGNENEIKEISKYLISMEKALVDEGKTPQQKASARTKRNDRHVKETHTFHPSKLGKLFGKKPTVNVRERSHAAGSPYVPPQLPGYKEHGDAKSSHSRKVVGTPRQTPHSPSTSFKHASATKKSENLEKSTTSVSNDSKTSKTKKTHGSLDKPSVFFKKEDFGNGKRPTIENLRIFLEKQRSKR